MADSTSQKKSFIGKIYHYRAQPKLATEIESLKNLKYSRGCRLVVWPDTFIINFKSLRVIIT